MSIRVEPERLISLSTEASRLKNIVDSQREVVESIERVLDYSLRTRAGIDEHLHRLRYVLASKVRQLEALEHHLVTSGKQYEAVDKQVCLMLGQELEIYEKALEHKAWYESNEFKFAVGAAVIAGLAVAAITIGGPILMGMLVGAAAGAVIGGAIGGVSSTLSGGDFWDGAADGWMVGSISGAITGGVAATGVGVAGAVLTDGLVDSGVYVYETVSKGKSVDPLGLGLSFAVGAGVSFLGTKASSALTKHFEKFRISNSVDEVIEGGSDVLKGAGKVISEADRLKLSKWTFKPSDELYMKYKKVFDDLDYYDQATGNIHWPKNDGFLTGSKLDIDVDDKMVFKRYGEPSGEFLGNATDSLESRALAPHSDGANEYYYRPTEKFKITSGKAAPWFGSNGGAMQFVKYKPDGNKFTIQEMLNMGLIEDVTEKVKKGVVKID